MRITQRRLFTAAPSHGAIVCASLKRWRWVSSRFSKEFPSATRVYGGTASNAPA